MSYQASKDELSWYWNFVNKGYQYVMYIEEDVNDKGFYTYDSVDAGGGCMGQDIHKNTKMWGCFSFMSGKILFLKSHHDYSVSKINHKTWKPVVVTDTNIIPVFDGVFPDGLIIKF